MKKLLILMVVFSLGSSAFAQNKTDTSMHHKMGTKQSKMKDCIMMKDGKMMVMKGDSTMPMEKEMTLKNGTTVMPDGTIKMKDGKTKMLKDNQCIYMDGKVGTMKMEKM